jgi:hypothetical protein
MFYGVVPEWNGTEGWNSFANAPAWSLYKTGWNSFSNGSFVAILELYPNDNDTVVIGLFSFAATVDDIYGDGMNLTWFRLDNGSWVQFGDSFSNITNGTYYKSPAGYFDLYDYTYQYKVQVTSTGGDSMEKIVTFMTASIDASGMISTPMVVLIILIFMWIFMLIMAEWKNDPFYGIICGVIGFVIIPAFWYAVSILEANVAFSSVWGFLNGYILIMNLAQAVNVAMGRDEKKTR